MLGKGLFMLVRDVSAAVCTRGVPMAGANTELIDMTLHESFKRRIRERMAATGERYTTARRALLSAAAQRPRGRTWVSEPEVDESSVRQATGRGWNEWCDLIEAWPGRDRGHGAVAAHLHAQQGLNGWWSQTITVGWERITGRRLPYQMADGTFTAGRSRTIALDAALLREWLLDAAARAGLFPGHPSELVSKPASKVIRLRLGDGIVTFSLGPARAGHTKVAVAHERLPSPEAADEWRFYWGEWLEALEQA